MPKVLYLRQVPLFLPQNRYNQLKPMKKKLILVLLILNFFSIGYAQNLNCQESKDNAEFVTGIWIGEFTQYSCGINATYPMTIEVNELEGKRFSGFFIWNDLPFGPNSKTTLKGEVIGDSIFLSEDTLVSGGNLVLNGVYEIEILDCTSLKGNYRLKELQSNCNDPQALIDGGRFTIKKLVPHIEEEEKSESEKRKVIIKERVNVSSDYITIKLWDNIKEDGDIITLRLNGQIAIDKLEVTKKPYEIIIPLIEKENIIELYAENVGTIPPNTAAIAIISGGKEIKSLVLKSDFNKSEAIRIVKIKNE